MNAFYIEKAKNITILISMLFYTSIIFGQNTNTAKQKSDFWEHVQFGGAVALNFGTNYTEVTLAPGAIYNFNQYFALGTGLQGTFIKSKGSYDSQIFGVNVIGLFNPISQIQLSAEIEELHINYTENVSPGVTFKDNYWNTGVFLGAGYRSGNATIGVRYNVTFNRDRNIYADAWMPFVRVYF